MGKTLSEKILGRKAGKEVSAGEVVTVAPDHCLSHDNSAAIIGEFKKLGVERVKAPGKLVIILDHIVPAADEKYAQNHKNIREFVAAQGLPNFFDIQHGVCHQVLSEAGFALPGKLIVGSDSHTTTYGAFGAFAAGIGRTEAASIWATDEIWLRVPETLRIEFSGKFPAGVFAKDVILKVIGDNGADRANYEAIEFTGRRPVTSAWLLAWCWPTWRPRWEPRTATSSRTRSRSNGSGRGPGPTTRLSGPTEMPSSRRC